MSFQTFQSRPNRLDALHHFADGCTFNPQCIGTSNSDSSVSYMTSQMKSMRSGYLQHRYHHPPCEQDKRQKITINVSGERYQTYVETLDRFPDTLLGNFHKREQFYDDVEDEYFFDRDRSAFNAILYYYQSNGQLYCPLTVPMTILVTEANFFELGKDALKQVLDLQQEQNEKEMPKNKWQKLIWCLFEHPETSLAAHFITIFSILMVVFSVTILCIETLPFARKKIDMEHASPKSKNITLTLSIQNNTISHHTIPQSSELVKYECLCVSAPAIGDNRTSPTIGEELETFNWHGLFNTFEAIFVAWFTFEFIVRFSSSPNKIQFLKGLLNIIDIVSILPFYITSALDIHNGLGFENFRVIRLVRVFRIFKLSRHSKGLQILGQTLKASMRELGLMIFFLAIGVILFSSAVYYLEADNFSSIPDAFWWAIITMCTVGYGDKVPKTFYGKAVGSACAVCGVLSIALPVPVIVSNFDYFYNRERTKKMHLEYLGDADSIKNNSDLILYPESKGSPLLHGDMQRNGSVRSATRSPVDARTDEIQRQATIKGLERRSRKLSQKLSEASLHSSPRRKNGNFHFSEKETYM